MASQQKVAFFIGGGNMATAIVAGINRSQWKIIVAEPFEPQRQKLTTNFPDIVVVESAAHDSIQVRMIAPSLTETNQHCQLLPFFPPG